jgi:hypothetical protein
MSKRILLVGALSLLCAAPVVAVVAPVLEEAFKSSDLEGLGKLIATYIKARSDNEGLGKAEENLNKEIQRHEKRLKKSPLAKTLQKVLHLIIIWEKKLMRNLPLKYLMLRANLFENFLV